MSISVASMNHPSSPKPTITEEEPNVDIKDREFVETGSASSSGQPDAADPRDIESERINTFIKPLTVSDSTLYDLSCRFADVYHHLAKTSDTQFLPTPLTSLPCGKEKGRYLAIDVGGSNLRVAFIHLLGDCDEDEATPPPPPGVGGGGNGPSSGGRAHQGTPRRSREYISKPSRKRLARTYEKTWPIGEHLKKDKEGDLFLWIGDCMAEVVADSLGPLVQKGEPVPEELEMGITFSFPMMQKSLSEATLMPTGKGFAITSDLNLGQTLLAGYERHTRKPYDGKQLEPSAKRRRRFTLPRLKIAAITNDAVATLASLAYLIKSLPNSRVAMGIIAGTGCNATIPMDLCKLHPDKAKHVRSQTPDAQQTIVNTEWTVNGTAPPLTELNITTKWDTMLDRACPRPGFQPFEYMTGGRYIGELVRIILYDYLTTYTNATQAALPANLVQPYALSTMYISQTVAQIPSDERLAATLQRTLPPPEFSEWYWTPVTAQAFRKIARAVQNRSAGLIASAVVGLLACQGELSLKEKKNSSSTLIQPGFGISLPVTHLNLPIIGASSSSANASSTSVAATAHSKSDSTASGRSSPGTASDNQVLAATTVPASWNAGPEEIVVAYTGGIIQQYPRFKETCQRYIDRLCMWNGPQESGKSVFLREASDGGIIGAGVLAGMVACHRDLVKR
ncbi:hypothetical protein KEM56_004378 [Ascosphaera pollenicola]|nr:hypothetical protein KEM56_004378 [Ascosphaera pollenicola]